ncbi:MAG: hypothetical protein ABSD81_03960 [Methanomicrobiales archaeon]
MRRIHEPGEAGTGDGSRRVGRKMGKTQKIKRVEKEENDNRPPALSADEESSGQGLDEFVCCVREEIRAMVGGHYYFIQVREECAMLCRVPLFAQERIRHEVMDHIQHGISDDDLCHAIGVRGGNAPPPGFYEISDHIERKLRALLDA